MHFQSLLRGVLFAAVSFSLPAQAPGHRYEALKNALGLSDFQLLQCQQSSPAASAIHQPVPRAGDRVFIYNYRTASSPDAMLDQLQKPVIEKVNRILANGQKTKLAEIEKALDRSSSAASLAISLGLMTVEQWPGQTLCFYPIRTYASELNLSDSQILQFEQLRHGAQEPVDAQIKEKENLRLGLLNSGTAADSPAIIQVVQDISKLQRQAWDTKPHRDLVLALLDDVQRAKFAALETGWELAREAIGLGLIFPRGGGEPLCN